MDHDIRTSVPGEVTVRSLATDNVLRVWLALIVLTVSSFILGAEHGGGYGSVIIVMLAGFKIRLVGLFFMELKWAPPYLRCIFEAYVVALTGLLTFLLLS